MIDRTNMSPVRNTMAVSFPAPPRDGISIHQSLAGAVRWWTRPDVRVAIAGQSSPLSATETWLLDYLVRNSAVRMSDVASFQNVDRSTVTAQISRLEERGLVERHHDTVDRRAVLVSATEAGEHALEIQASTAARLYHRILEAWPAADREHLVMLLERFVGDLDAVGSTTVGRS